MPLNEEQNYNISQLELIQSGSSQYAFPSGSGDYVNFTIFDGGNSYRTSLNSQIYNSDGEDIIGEFNYIIDATNTVRIKPNDILDELAYSTGNYICDLNFLRSIWFDLEESLVDDILANAEDNNVNVKPKFFIQEISPTRKEVRLLARRLNPDFWVGGSKYNEPTFDDDYPINSIFQDKFKTLVGTLDNNDGYPRYDFKYVLNIGEGKFPVINNYAFDNISDSDFSSLIIRLNEPLPRIVNINDFVSIEKELINTQYLSIFYESSVQVIQYGEGLDPDNDVALDINNQDDVYQNYNQLTVNSENASFQHILSEITSSDKNLNINFNKFKNHTFFGSVESKLKNFKDKVGNIQNNFREISASLGLDSAVSMLGDKNYIQSRRRELFDNVNSIVTSFTPYEKFLYYDSQNSSTASAPGIGTNLAHTKPVADHNDELTILSSSYDGFGAVYRHKSSADGYVDLFTNKYLVQEAPFFNYSGSVYLSFLVKGHEYINSGSGYSNTSWDSDGTSRKLTWQNSNHNLHTPTLPEKTFGGSRILNPTITGSKWQRAIFVASQSYWEPITPIADYIPADWLNAAEGTKWRLLSGSNITGSGIIESPGGYDTYPDQFSSEYQFTGSVMPMGELFRIYYDSTEAETTSSFVTDVKVTLKNPLESYPFDYTYKTGSADWTNWYDGMLISASAFDEENIHSLKNNLPDYMGRDNDFGELHTFVNMIGEHFDLIRNYIDNYNNLYSRNYSQIDSIPGEMLPSIIKSFGWDAINPFSGSLDSWFSYSQVGSTRKTVAERTYRKILNNLMYIYKTKGTENSIKALLNCYGYPSDFLPIRMYGGNYETSDGDLVVLNGVHQSPRVVTFDAQRTAVGDLVGNQSFELVKDNYYQYNITNRQLNLPWWKDGANGDGIEFVFSANPSGNVSQNLLISSGSGNRQLWKLQLRGSGPSKPNQAFLSFRLSNTTTGSTLISGLDSEVMATPRANFRNGDLWNVYLTRNTDTASNALTQSYHLYAALQDGESIPIVVSSSMVISSSNNIAAFTGTGSFSGSTDTLSSKNLVVGNAFTGSISEIRMWSGSLSASSFKMHVLDKHSVRGNTLLDSQKKLIYRFRCNENSESGSIQRFIDSSNSDVVKDFSFTDGVISSSFFYNKRVIDFVKFGIKTDPHSLSNTQRVNIDDKQYSFSQNLSPDKPSLIDISSFGRRKTSNKIDIAVSTADTINKKILSEIGGFDVTDKFGTPSDVTGSKYAKLENLRNSILKNVVIDQNKFIRAYKNVFNNAIVNNIKKVLPASSNLNSIGVVIKQDLLDRIKIRKGPKKIEREHYQPLSGSLEDIFDFSNSSVYNPHTAIVSGSDIDLTGQLLPLNTNAKLNVLSSSLGINSNIPTINETTLDIMSNSLTSSIFNMMENPIKIDVLSISGSRVDEHLLNLNELTGSFGGEILSSFDDNINITDGVSHFILSGSIISPISGSITKIFDSNIQISQSINDKIFDVNFKVLSASLALSSEKLSPKNSTIDLISSDNLNLTSSIHFPILSNDIHLASASLQLSSSYFNPLLGEIDADVSVYSISSLFEKSYENSNSDIISQSIVFSAEFQTSYDSNIYIISESSTINSSILNPLISNDIHIASGSFVLSSSYQSSLSDTIDLIEYLGWDGSVFNVVEGDTASVLSQSIDVSQSIEYPLNSNIYISESQHITSEVLNPHTGSVSFFNDGVPRIAGKEYIPGYGYISHGKGLNDVWYMHPNSPGSSSDYNTYKADTDYVIKAFGDVEIQSSSRLILTGSAEEDGGGNTLYLRQRHGEEHIDFTNHHSFKNKQIISGTDVQYKSYINGGDGIQHGTPVGRTTYFSASSDGTIYYPINHEINYHTVRQQLRFLYTKKSDQTVSVIDRDTGNIIPNQKLGQGEFKNGLDLIPTSSAYTIKVTGTDVTRLKVERLNKKNK